MKGYKPFLFAFIALFVLYLLAELNRPKQLDWSMTLSKDDKNPYGAYVLYNSLSDLFPAAGIRSYRSSIFEQLNNNQDQNTAYILIEPTLSLSDYDINELVNYVSAGNFVLISSSQLAKALLDTLQLKITARFSLLGKDTCYVNFTNPQLRAKKDFDFRVPYFDDYFRILDTANSTVLGMTRVHEINFVKIKVGDGAFLLHSSPVCFSNFFMLKDDNAEYTSRALSYIPQNVSKIYWDEYYKLGPLGSSNPLHFVLMNGKLKWAFWIATVGIILFVLFEMKRRQRIIPVLDPLRNTTLDFVRTVGNLYFNQHDNKNIAAKKINYFLGYVRTNFYLATNLLNEEFILSLSKKSGIEKRDIEHLTILVQEIQQQVSVSDGLLIELNKRIDHFYKNVK